MGRTPSLCISAYVHGEYENFVPFYVWSALRAHPDCHVRVFTHQRLNDAVGGLMDRVRKRMPGSFDIIEGVFADREPDKHLRWLLGPQHFDGFEYVWLSDVDIVCLAEQPPLLEFHVGHCKRYGVPYSNLLRNEPNRPERLTGCHFFCVEPYFDRMGALIDEVLSDDGFEFSEGSFAYHDMVGSVWSDEHLLYRLVKGAFGIDEDSYRELDWSNAPAGSWLEWQGRPENCFPYHHGLHLGWLRRSHPPKPYTPNHTFWLCRQDEVRELLRDPLFAELREATSGRVRALLDELFLTFGRPRPRGKDGSRLEVLEDRKALYALLLRDAVVGEIGVQNGDNAQVIWETAKPRELHLIDLWSNRKTPRWASWPSSAHRESMRKVSALFQEQIKAGRVILHQGYSQQILAAFPDGYFDWVYLDSDHRYESVLADLELCRRKVRPGGIIAGHDYVDPQFSSWARDGQYGVIEAVTTFCQRHPWDIVYLTKGAGLDVWLTEANASFALAESDREATTRTEAVAAETIGQNGNVGPETALAAQKQAEGRPVREPVRSLWIGDRLTKLEQLAVRSFLANGHGFELFVYDDVEDVPEGATLRSAAEILPMSGLFRYPDGSVACFANLFRYELLLREGGWWVDMDVVCLRAFDFGRAHVFGWQDSRELCNAVMRAPKDSALAALLCEASRGIGGDVPWGTTGPALLTALAKKTGMTSCAEPPTSFYPVHWTRWQQLFEAGREVPTEGYAVHFWHEMTRRHGLDLDGRFPKTSMFERLKSRYL